MDGTDQDPQKTRKTLLDRIKDLEDASSWQEFIATYQQLVHRVARRQGVTELEAEDVAQEVFKRVAQTIHQFKHANRRGSFRKWLSQLVRWRAADVLRTPGRNDDSLDAEEPDSPTPSPINCVAAEDEHEKTLEEEARRQLLQLAFKRLQTQIAPKQLQIFQCLVFEGWDVERVAATFQTNPAAIYVAKHRVASRMRSEIDAIRQKLDGGSQRSTSKKRPNKA